MTVSSENVSLYDGAFNFKHDNKIYKTVYDNYRLPDDTASGTVNEINVSFINKTVVDLSFRQHQYDDDRPDSSIQHHHNPVTGLIFYIISDSDKLYVLILGTTVKVYIVQYTNERQLTDNYGSHVFQILNAEPECFKSVYCNDHVKSLLNT